MFLRSSKVQLVVGDGAGFHFTSIPVDVNYNTKLVADVQILKDWIIFLNLKINLTKILINFLYFLFDKIHFVKLFETLQT